MSIFEHDNYDMNYQRYLDWKDEQEQLERELEGYEEYEYDLLREQQIDEMRAAMYQDETTGERVVRTALSGIAEETEEDVDVRQLAQITVNGIYTYDLNWLPESHEVRAEIDIYSDKKMPIYYWYPDTMGTMEVLSQLLGVPKERLSITALAFFTPERVIDDLYDHERQQFLKGTWLDYAWDDMAMQFNVNIAEKEEETPVVCKDCYDAACDGTNCEFKSVARPHGIDGTQCDCFECGQQGVVE
jgi:hypothetical protein